MVGKTVPQFRLRAKKGMAFQHALWKGLSGDVWFRGYGGLRNMIQPSGGCIPEDCFQP